MRYYVVSDVHGFYSILMDTLEGKGFFSDTDPHKLIICGDLLDRGKEAKEMQKFACDLLDKDELIFIRGNHEDLMLEMVKNFNDYRESLEECYKFGMGWCHHYSNGTFDSALQLTGMAAGKAIYNPDLFIRMMSNTDFFSKLIPASKNYFETEHYVFAHGWIPTFFWDEKKEIWRNSGETAWGRARWLNGIDEAVENKNILPDKTIVCGHYHCSYGHYKYGEAKSEYRSGADFSPFKAEGILAIDACTALSKKINCVVIME